MGTGHAAHLVSTPHMFHVGEAAGGRAGAGVATRRPTKN